ncbi:hypothetical protein DXG03_006259 [Asterophora parasitica]|uniref:Uncharacterized protein n=1 Tax=Asterophora parasitica TaxID=117018 RepID=A0A9P7KE18_9AGAR|nr:hypothetical protein DXG03_006259 [Asterophora parasitica]
MEPLRKLRDLIAKVDYNQLTKLDHREIYQIIERDVLSPKSPIIKQVPPLDLIVYTLNQLVRPTLETRRIPDILDLLATVEFYRKTTSDHVSDALVWNDYYAKDKTVQTISKEEQQILEAYGNDEHQNTLRTIYIQILTISCDLDMYLMWTAIPPSMSDFMIRFNEYFPSINPYCHKSRRLFHSDLSEEETAKLKAVGLECCHRAQATVEWAMGHAGEGQTWHHAFQTEAFKKVFERPVDDEELQKLILYFAEKVAKAAKQVQDMFGDS